MKKKFFVIGTVLAMLVIMVFPCYGELQKENGCYIACYQKNNGQLRLLTDRKDNCRLNAEDRFLLCLGGPTDVPRTCAAQIDCGTTPCTYKNETCEITAFDVSVSTPGRYKITFKDKFTAIPVCVIYVYPNADYGFHDFAEYEVGEAGNDKKYGEITFYTFLQWDDGGVPEFYVNRSFNFICTEP